MSAISKQALLVDNNQSFPNNNAGEITPSDLRAFNVNVIDSTVNQTEYTTNSGSWNVSISNINAFTASQQPSFTALNSFTASQLTINGGVNTFTQSASGRLNNLESTTSSLNAWSSSINEIRDNGVFQGYSTRLFFEGLVSASIVTNVGGNIATINIEQDGTKLNTSSFNSYTASNNQSFNSYTASTNQRINSLEVFSSSTNISISELNAFTTSVGPIQTGSLLNTASYSGTTITYTKGDASTFTNVGIQNTASFNSYTASQNLLNSTFATTGSNTFVGIQTINNNTNINGDLFVSGTADLGFVSIRDNGAINLYGTGSTRQSYGIVTNPANGDLVFNTNPGNGRLMTFNETDGIMNLWNGMKLDTSFIGIDVYDHPLNLSSSFGGMTTMLSTKGDIVVSGSMIASGSAVVTGPMVVAGVQNINYTSGSGLGEVYLLGDSGSLVIGASNFTPTYGALAHLSSSVVNGNTNLIFKPNNSAGDTIISGSSNIFTNPGNPTAGFKRYIGGSQNYFGATLPQISGSTGFSPTFTSNIINSGFIMRTPVSSSTYTIQGNLVLLPSATSINLGTTAVNNFEKAVAGFVMQNNVIGGQINAIAAKTTLSASVNMVTNNIGGILNLNMDSSSITFSNNIVYGTLAVNNSYFPATTGSQVSTNLTNGLYVGSNSIFLSGSNTTLSGQPGRLMLNSGMIGSSNVISASYNSDLAQVNSTIVLGQSLNVLGTNSRTSNADYGSVFVGRWNDFSGNKGGTGETVFAIGTGTGAATRKTGFLIDSGSNTYVEGTLNVSGSSTFTGSIVTSGSVVGNVVSMSIASSTASMDLNSGNFFTLTLVSGSATHLAASNIKAGQTINLLVSQPSIGTGSLTYNSTFDWPATAQYSASVNSGSKDIISFISFDSSILYGTAVKNLQ